MVEIKYVIRFFSAADEYLYSVHCSADILDQLLTSAKADGKKVKVVAYSSEDSSEV